MISIIIPIFNEIHYLETFVTNLKDSFKNEEVEYIFVNDGSTDGSKEWIDNYIKKQDQQIKQKLAGSFVRTSRYKLYGDGRFYDVRKDVEEKRILTELTPKQTDIRATLQAVHDEKPKWAYFAPSKN